MDDIAEQEFYDPSVNAVSLLTIHASKGLEFAHVFLIGAEENALPKASQSGTREIAEEKRLFYVAATRARDLIVVPAIGDGEHDGWLAKLNPVVYPASASRRNPITRHPMGCPEFGDDSVLTRPDRAPDKMKSVAPGLYRAIAGEHEVVWWDPSRLILQVEEAMGLRQNKLLQADEKKLISLRGMKMHEVWTAKRAEMLAAGIAPAITIATATELALERPAQGLEFAGEIAIEETRRDRGRPHGKKFGTLVHLTMLRAGFGADASEVASIAGSAGRMIGASEEEVASATAAVVAALESPLIQRARAADTVMRECPLMVRLEDGVMAEGIADLAFAEGINRDAKWTVVDFKTDLEIGASRIDEYRSQIGLYIHAIRQSTGQRATGAILWI